MNASLEILVWLLSSIASLGILAIFWSWVRGRLNEAVPPLRRDSPVWPPSSRIIRS